MEWAAWLSYPSQAIALKEHGLQYQMKKRKELGELLENE